MISKTGIRDVAQMAGVSIGTVSNVLNGLATVRPANRERVERAMEQLGFVPNSLARQLRAGHGDAIAMVVPSIANPFYGEVAHVAEAIAERHGSTIIIASSDQGSAREARFVSMFEASRVRGLLVSPVAGATTQLADVRRRGTPVVLLDDHIDVTAFCSVSLDGRAAGSLAVQHLFDVGRRRIAVVGGPVSRIADRVTGAGEAARQASGGALTIIETDELTVSDGRRAARRILDLPPPERPDGIFAANDLVALGVMMEFVLGGLRIPQDVAIVGYDDIDFAATALIPLTTIAQPRAEIAAEAIRLLLDEENELNHRHEKRLLAPELIVRASTLT